MGTLNHHFSPSIPTIVPRSREILRILTYVALLIVNGDEAYAGITGDVLASPRDINLHACFIKEAQSIARGVAHRCQLLPLAFTNYCGRKNKNNLKNTIFPFSHQIQSSFKQVPTVCSSPILLAMTSEGNVKCSLLLFLSRMFMNVGTVAFRELKSRVH